MTKTQWVLSIVTANILVITLSNNAASAGVGKILVKGGKPFITKNNIVKKIGNSLSKKEVATLMSHVYNNTDDMVKKVLPQVSPPEQIIVNSLLPEEHIPPKSLLPPSFEQIKEQIKKDALEKINSDAFMDACIKVGSVGAVTSAGIGTYQSKPKLNKNLYQFFMKLR